MSSSRSQPLTVLLATAGAIALALPLAAQAGRHGGDCDHDRRGGPGHFQRGDGERLPPGLRDLDLSDAQREQIGKILREQSDQMRARSEALRQEREAQRAKVQQQIDQVLTAEQRQQLEQRRKERDAWRQDREERRQQRQEQRTPAPDQSGGGR